MSAETTYGGGPELPICQFSFAHPGRRLTATVDGKTRDGPWAYMCDECHDRFGVGLGTGRGQRLTLPGGER